MKLIAVVLGLLGNVAFADPLAEPKADADAGYYGGVRYLGGGLGASPYYRFKSRYYGKRDAEPKANAGLYTSGYYGNLGYTGHFGYPYASYAYYGQPITCVNFFSDHIISF